MRRLLRLMTLATLAVAMVRAVQRRRPLGRRAWPRKAMARRLPADVLPPPDKLCERAAFRERADI